MQPRRLDLGKRRALGYVVLVLACLVVQRLTLWLSSEASEIYSVPSIDVLRIDVNCATAAELQRLPGLGPALASRIVTARERRDGFERVDDLHEVSGIGPAKLARWRRVLEATSSCRKGE